MNAWKYLGEIGLNPAPFSEMFSHHLLFTSNVNVFPFLQDDCLKLVVLHSRNVMKKAKDVDVRTDDRSY